MANDTLDVFIDDDSLSTDESVEGFFDDDSQIKNSDPKPTQSNLNMAATVSQISGGDVIADFETTLTGLETDPDHLENNPMIGDVRKSVEQADKNAILEMLSDISIPIQDKDNLVKSFQKGQTLRSTLPELLADKNISEASDGETPEGEAVRVDVAGIVKEFLAVQKLRQHILNAELAKSDPNIFGQVLSIGELLIPFAEEASVASMSRDLKELTGDKDLFDFGMATLLMGQARVPMSKMLDKMSFADQRKFLQGIVDIANQHKGLIFTDENDFIHKRNLEILLKGESAYSFTDMIIDDIISVADATIVGGFILRRFRPGLTAVRGLSILSKKESKALIGVESQAKAELEKTIEAIIEGPATVEKVTGKPIVRGKLAANDNRVPPTRNSFERAGDIIRKAQRDGVRSNVAPASISQVIKQTNPEKFRVLHNTAAANEEIAKVAYGTSSREAVLDDILPEIFDVPNEFVKAKVHKPNITLVDEFNIDKNIQMFIDVADGSIFFTKPEKAVMRIKAETKMLEAISPETRVAMYQVDDLDDGLRIRAVFGPRDASGYRNPQEALDLAEITYREHGITRDNMILLERVGDSYKPVSKDVITDGDYLIGIDYRYGFAASDLGSITPLSVKRNFFDLFPPATEGRHGTLARMAFDAHSMLSPTITLGANKAVDFSFGLENQLKKIGTKWAKSFLKLPTESRDLVAGIIYKANAESVEPTVSSIRAIGGGDREITILQEWRKLQDTLYLLENLDFSKSLRNRGFMRYVNTKSDSIYFARPNKRADFDGPVNVIDPESGKLIEKTVEEIDEIYKNGGTLAELKDSIVVGNSLAEFVVSTEKVGSDYLRAISSGEKVINRLPGYYSVRYKEGKFIEKQYLSSRIGPNGERFPILDRFGNPKTVAVGTAANIKDANVFRDRLTAVTPAEDNVRFIVRNDKNDIHGFSSNYDLAHSQGRMATRHRGVQLEDGSGNVASLQQSNIQDPLESLVQSIRSISRRVSMRDYLEATKARFLIQYSDVLGKDKFGRSAYPESRKSITTGGQPRKIKQAADARTTFEYIQFLENGYVDALDEGLKAMFNLMADVVGGSKLSSLEGGVRALGSLAPNAKLKSTAFNLYIALNPLRQSIIQSHQSVMLLAFNPKHMLNPRGMFSEFAILIEASMRKGKVSKGIAAMSGKTVEEAELMAKQFVLSGLSAAVDSNTLVRSSYSRLADLTYFQKLKSAVGFVPRLSQRVGFDVGEMTNIATGWLSFRNMAIVKNGGKPLGPEQLGLVTAEARNFTFNMNRAGDFPYTQNALRAIFQFVQIPHKAFLNSTFNRAIPPSVRAKTALLNIVLFGTGTGLLGQWVMDKMDIKDEEARTLIQHGIEDVGANSILTALSGEETNIDFSSLAPSDVHGMSNFIFKMLKEKTIWDVIASSPGGTLYFGNDARVTNAVKEGMRLIGVLDDSGSDIVTMMSTMKAFVKMSSGFSNTFKALYALEFGKAINSRSEETDDEVNAVEAVFQAFGLPTKDTSRLWATNRELYEESKAALEDASEAARMRVTLLRQQGFTGSELMAQAIIGNEFLRVFSEKQKAKYFAEIAKAAESKEQKMQRSLTKAMGLITPDKYEAIIRNAPIKNESDREDLLFFNQHAKDLIERPNN